MSLEAQGAYRNLLDAAWENGGKLPNVRGVLWRYALAQDAQDFERVAADVLAMFTESACGQFLINETLLEEWRDSEARMEQISEVRSAAGKIGNEKRWKSKIANRSQAVAKGSQANTNQSQAVAQDKTEEEKTANQIKNFSPEASSAPSAICLPLNTGTEFQVFAETVTEWQSLYPGVDVLQELRKMRGWLLANLQRRKTARGIRKFINAWLSRAQDESSNKFNGRNGNGQKHGGSNGAYRSADSSKFDREPDISVH
jgi:uncharacterized protein YdaU (DUF1376 family)